MTGPEVLPDLAGLYRDADAYADVGQDYGLIERAGGMRPLVVVDSDGYAVQPNPHHRGYAPAEAP